MVQERLKEHPGFQGPKRKGQYDLCTGHRRESLFSPDIS